MKSRAPSFIVATPSRTVCDDNARTLVKHGLLRLYALATRRGTTGIPLELTRLNPAIGLIAYAAARSMGIYRAESVRFALLPWFDRWVESLLRPGDHIISSYGYTTSCFAWVQRHGGKTFVDAGNSHPEQFWEILQDEHRRWGVKHPPVARHWIDRGIAMMEHVDFVLCPSNYVRESFLKRGFLPQQILGNIYPIDLDQFKPASEPRPTSRPLTVINTGSLSLRKGTPYLLEAFRLIRKEVPDARLLLTSVVFENVRPVLRRYPDIPIEWSPSLSHAALADRLRSADIFVMPSLEEGLVRTVLEAMACGLPCIVTPHTGANDFIIPGMNGDVVPIRDGAAVARLALDWWSRLQRGYKVRVGNLDAKLSFRAFEKTFEGHLSRLGLLENVT